MGRKLRAEPRRDASNGARRGTRSELVALHQAIYRRQQAEINASVHGYTRAFRSYEATYRAHVARCERPISYDQVVRRAVDADVVYVGDYHTLPLSQKAFAQLVHRAVGHGRPVALALEFILAAHQRALDAYLAGRIAEATFLRRIGYPGHHVFRVWPNFKRVFDLARDLALPVLGLDLEGAGLAQRDRFAAGRIVEYRRAHPQAQLFVLTGQLHVAPPHLPQAVVRAEQRAGRPAPSHLVVYQNPEEIYWQLTGAGLEQTVDAVEIGPDEVGLVICSPVVAQQSYLNHLHEDDPFDESLETAPERTFKQMCEVLATFLEADVGDALDRVTVYSLGDLSFLEDLKAEGTFTAHELEYMERQILASESTYIPRARIVYLGNLSLNHAAEEAAHFLRHALTEDDGDRDGLVDAFYARVMNEALAFFGSKVINPRRRCLHERDLEALVAAWDAGDRDGLHAVEAEAARLVLVHLRVERGERVSAMRGVYGVADADLFNAVTHLLGYILGDRLYYGMLRGKTTKAELRQIFFDPLDEEGDVFHVYFYLSSKVASVRVPRRP